MKRLLRWLGVIDEDFWREYSYREAMGRIAMAQALIDGQLSQERQRELQQKCVDAIRRIEQQYPEYAGKDWEDDFSFRYGGSR